MVREGQERNMKNKQTRNREFSRKPLTTAQGVQANEVKAIIRVTRGVREERNGWKKEDVTPGSTGAVAKVDKGAGHLHPGEGDNPFMERGGAKANVGVIPGGRLILGIFVKMGVDVMRPTPGLCVIC